MASIAREMEPFLTAFPFLKQIPDRLLSRLDTAEFALPTPELVAVQAELESRLGGHVMVYQKEGVERLASGKFFLCWLLVPAELEEEGLSLVVDAEERFHALGVYLVVYAKPLRFR